MRMEEQMEVHEEAREGVFSTEVEVFGGHRR